MTTEQFEFTGDSGTSHYLAIFNAAGQVYDWDDGTFKSLASAVEKTALATEKSDMGGTGGSGYVFDVDLAGLNNTATPAKFYCDWYTDANATARVSNTEAFYVKSSGLYDPQASSVTVGGSLTEPSGAPPATPSFEAALAWLYFLTTNEVVVEEALKTFKKRNGDPLVEQVLTETDTTYTEGAMQAP